MILYGRFSGDGLPRPMVVTNILRVEDGRLAEHWDVVQDEATADESKSVLPMIGSRFFVTKESSPSTKAASNTTALTQFLEVKGHSYAYRRFGKGSGIPASLSHEEVMGAIELIGTRVAPAVRSRLGAATP